MATTDFNHGTRVITDDTSSRPLEVADYSVIGAAVTAPAADAAVFPLNEPVAFYTHEAEKVAALGATGNALSVVNAIRAQGIEARVVMVRVAEGTGETEAEKKTGTIANLVGSAATMTGVHALSYALGHAGVEPTLLIAPGYSAGRISNAKNPVADALEQVSEKLKAIAIFDTGGADTAESLAYRADFSSKRTFLVDPFVKVLAGEDIVTAPSSPFVAAMFAKKDKLKGGPYFSPSNQEVKGILGTARPITFFDGEQAHEANALNQAGIATFIPSQVVQDVGGQYAANGRILWGNRTAATDALWRFVNVVRTRDVIEKAIIRGFRPWANDQNMTAQHVLSIVRSLQTLLDELRSVGAILGGSVTFERDQNPNANLRAGKLRIAFDAEETPPLEDLIFISRRNEDYFDNLAADIQRLISVEFASTIGEYTSAT